MKILMIAPEPFLEPRGTPISVFQRLRALAALGHEIELLTYPLGSAVSIPGVTVHRVPRIPGIRSVPVGPSWPKLWFDTLMVFKAIGMLIRARYDVIHSHEEAAFFAMILAGIFRIRHIYDMHSSLPRQLANFRFANSWIPIRLFETLERMVLKSCDVVITIGQDLEGYVRSIHPAAQVITIENIALRIPEQKQLESEIAQIRSNLGINGQLPIVYTGTFEPYQGLDLLIRSAGRIRDQLENAVFILVGGNPEQVKRWESVICEQGVQDCFVLTGSVPVTQVWAYLELAEILVSPRIGGTSVPLKIYNYLEAGKPILATNLSAHRMVLNDKLAMLVEPTEHGIAEGLARLIADPELRKKLGARSKQLAVEINDPREYTLQVQRAYGLIRPPGGADPIATSWSQNETEG